MKLTRTRNEKKLSSASYPAAFVREYGSIADEFTFGFSNARRRVDKIQSGRAAKQAKRFLGVAPDKATSRRNANADAVTLIGPATTRSQNDVVVRLDFPGHDGVQSPLRNESIRVRTPLDYA